MIGRLIRSQTARPSRSSRSSSSSTRYAATNSAPSPCSRISRLAARHMSRSGITRFRLDRFLPHPVNSERRLRLLHIYHAAPLPPWGPVRPRRRPHRPFPEWVPWPGGSRVDLRRQFFRPSLRATLRETRPLITENRQLPECRRL
jgi:hypothetical protein